MEGKSVNIWKLEIDNIELIEKLETTIKSLDEDNSLIVTDLFKKGMIEMENLLRVLTKTGNSDFIISFGKNNRFIKKAIEILIESDKFKKAFKKQPKSVYLNSLVHNSDEVVLEKICDTLELNSSKQKNYQEILKEYFSEKKKNKLDEYLVIYFENLELIFQKKKQSLFYTLLELLNNSTKVLFVGMTNHYNLTDLMEKRLRSRFNNNLINLQVEEKFDLLNLFHIILTNNVINEMQSINTYFDKKKQNDTFCMNVFSNIIFDNSEFRDKINYYFDCGFSVMDIINRIKYLFCQINLELQKRVHLFNERICFNNNVK